MTIHIHVPEQDYTLEDGEHFNINVRVVGDTSPPIEPPIEPPIDPPDPSPGDPIVLPPMPPYGPVANNRWDDWRTSKVPYQFQADSSISKGGQQLWEEWAARTVNWPQKRLFDASGYNGNMRNEPLPGFERLQGMYRGDALFTGASNGHQGIPTKMSPQGLANIVELAQSGQGKEVFFNWFEHWKLLRVDWGSADDAVNQPMLARNIDLLESEFERLQAALPEYNLGYYDKSNVLQFNWTPDYRFRPQLFRDRFVVADQNAESVFHNIDTFFPSVYWGARFPNDVPAMERNLHASGAFLRRWDKPIYCFIWARNASGHYYDINLMKQKCQWLWNWFDGLVLWEGWADSQATKNAPEVKALIRILRDIAGT